MELFDNLNDLYLMFSEMYKKYDNNYIKSTMKTPEEYIMGMIDDNFVALALGRETKYRD